MYPMNLLDGLSVLLLVLTQSPKRIAVFPPSRLNEHERLGMSIREKEMTLVLASSLTTNITLAVRLMRCIMLGLTLIQFILMILVYYNIGWVRVYSIYLSAGGRPTVLPASCSRVQPGLSLRGR